MFKEIEEFFKERYEGWEGVAQFEGLSRRFERLIEEMCWPISKVKGEVDGCFQAVFEDSYDEMLVCKDVSVWTLCPHHLLPCLFKVNIGYIPLGKVLGLSKFARVAVALGKTPIMQEQYTRDLADTFWNELKPEGLGVYVTGRHGCMGCRGVNQDIDVVTSTLRGSFMELGVREEFYAICRG